MTVKQVWQAGDGSTHETEAEAVEADIAASKFNVLEGMYDASHHGTIRWVIREWDDIKKVMEG